jgi:hypothetical protein
VVAEKDEGDKVVPEGCSPKHERWQRGGVITAEASHCAGIRAEWRARERGGVVQWRPGWCSPLMGSGVAPVRRLPRGNGWH